MRGGGDHKGFLRHKGSAGLAKILMVLARPQLRRNALKHCPVSKAVLVSLDPVLLATERNYEPKGQ